MVGDGDNVTGGNGRRVQVRRAPRVSFGAGRRQVFLDHLAACCNVKRAAAAAGVGVTTVYETRRREAGFAQQWAEAMEIGYATLEALMVERAGAGGHYEAGETPVPSVETIDTYLALELLKLHRAPAGRQSLGGAPVRMAKEKDLAEALVARLDGLERRRKRGASPGSADPTSDRPSPQPSPARGEGVSEA